MACTSLSITRTEGIFKGQSDLRESRTNIQRYYSDNHLCYCMKPIHAALAQPKLKSSRYMGFFPFQFSSSLLPNSVRSFFICADKYMSMEREMADNSAESSEGEEDQEIKRLVEIRSIWKNRQQKEVGDKESVCHEGKDGDCECREGSCSVDYINEEDNEGITWDSFQRFLVKVPWSNTKQFSKLAFLSNLAYVIPPVEVDVLKKFFGLRFVTSSIARKAEAEKLKVRLYHDAIRLPVADEKASSEAAADSEQKHSIHPSIAWEIAESAASYVRSLDTDGGDQPQQREEGGSFPQSNHSEIAVSLTASTMTAVVTAGEQEKQETAEDLRSLHSTPCE